MTVKRTFATDRFVAEPMTGEADEQGIRIESAHGRADLPWALMHRVVVRPNLITIYLSATSIRILSREFFADDESWQAFRRLAAAAAPPPSTARSRRMWIVVLWLVIVVGVVLTSLLFGRK